MAEAVPLDSNWLRAHPLPRPDHETDKNGRGRVLAVGGSRQVPGGIALTAEGALRAGAGKVRIGTVASLAVPLGLAMPEIGVIALPESAEGEIAGAEVLTGSLERCDALVAGPAMSDDEAARALLPTLLGRLADGATVVLDAAVLSGLDRPLARPAILTPHAGEMAGLLGCEAQRVAQAPRDCVIEAAARFGAIVALKGATTLIATPAGELFAYAGGGVGLATAGSGDVMAGIAAGLAARGADPLVAAMWAVWLHGEAGRRCAHQIGPIGFLARELLAEVPALMAIA